MKSLLIVEDEKLIRQGIHTMAARSGVPIDEIYEANNGEVALAILKEHKIDVMFTDIRMPRMDGIELVKHLKELDYIPHVVAVSGYDDFSYAVEMLRNGASEYMLKPVEREKVHKVLFDLDQIIKEENMEKENGNNAAALMECDYAVAIFPEQNKLQIGRNYVRLHGVTGAVGILISKDLIQSFKEEYEACAVGISRIHNGEAELKLAITEAFEARMTAFCKEELTGVDDQSFSVPDSLRIHAEGLVTETKRTQRIQILSTDKTQDFFKVWGCVFEEARRGYLSPELFVEDMNNVMHELRKVYKHAMTEEELKETYILEQPLNYTTISEYEESTLELLVNINKNIINAEDEEPTQKKIAQAVNYIREHFAEDMNMATVSNHISMNYTLFSYSFKQYTGQNFVSYLKEIRLKEACRWLAETDDKIIDIAHEVGYRNEKHFLKTFKAELGISPSEYRRNMKRCETI